MSDTMGGAAKALGFERVFFSIGIIGLLAIPLVFMIPERVRKAKS